MEGKGVTEAAERQVGPRTEGAEKTAEWQRSESSLLSDQAGSSPAKPELGQEVASEGEALIEAFRNGQPFYTVTAWKAVPEVNGANPVIVKQAFATKRLRLLRTRSAGAVLR